MKTKREVSGSSAGRCARRKCSRQQYSGCLQSIHFNGRLSVIVQNGQVLKSGYEEGYFRQAETGVTARLQ